jgi:hypothetical protein
MLYPIVNGFFFENFAELPADPVEEPPAAAPVELELPLLPPHAATTMAAVSPKTAMVTGRSFPLMMLKTPSVPLLNIRAG